MYIHKEPPRDLCNLPPTLKVSSEMGVACVFGAELTIRKCVRGKAVKMFARAAARLLSPQGEVCPHTHMRFATMKSTLRKDSKVSSSASLLLHF